MYLTFTDETGKKITLTTEPSTSILKVRLELLKLTRQIVNIELDGKKIPFTDKKLIQHYEIKENSNLRISPASREEINIALDQLFGDDAHPMDLYPNNKNLCIDFDMTFFKKQSDRTDEDLVSLALFGSI